MSIYLILLLTGTGSFLLVGWFNGEIFPLLPRPHQVDLLSALRGLSTLLDTIFMFSSISVIVPVSRVSLLLSVLPLGSREQTRYKNSPANRIREKTIILIVFDESWIFSSSLTTFSVRVLILDLDEDCSLLDSWKDSLARITASRIRSISEVCIEDVMLSFLTRRDKEVVFFSRKI